MRLVILALPVSLAACIAVPPPMVSDYNGHMVKIVDHPYALGDKYKQSPIYTLAKETCGKEAVYQGMRQINEYQGEHVFLCR
ncbi:hypothetical protein [Rhodovulum sulfidophilum]|uniref:hypothetical protein n=1 Tax=Rhodovulum sulfidophilum TaxID=35806 RepID=UPI00095168AF|nr:hypothetical protein [Rhodovulum sulfidophilum]OLS46850.1 hypothetical protein BV379_00120 [Rhodovulum sulfidophilum]